MSTSSSLDRCCVFCKKSCNQSDSGAFPDPDSLDRIHKKCRIKKNLKDRLSDRRSGSKQGGQLTLTTNKPNRLNYLKKPEMNKLLEPDEKSSNQFFFDMKAGIAKPHERGMILHHKKLIDIATRYDDNGFANDVQCASYNHMGKSITAIDKDEESLSGEEDHSTIDDSHNSPCDKIKSSISRKNLDVGRKRISNSDLRQTPKKLARINIDDKNPCWFCLSSSKLEKHLLIYIGEHCYLSLAKGGLCDEHFLISPIEHVSSLNDTDENSKEVLCELEQFKKSLTRYFEHKALGVIFYERNFKTVHWQLQVVPISLQTFVTLEEKIKSISKKHYEKVEYIDIPKDCDLSDMIPRGAPYFYWQIEPLGSRFVTQIRTSDSYFPIQFGRAILADPDILNCMELIDWKSCVKTQEEYTNLVKRVKADFRF